MKPCSPTNIADEVVSLFAGQLSKDCKPDRIGKVGGFETMKHAGPVDLHRPDTDAQTMGDRLVRLSLHQAIEDLSLAPGQLRDLVSRLACTAFGWRSRPDLPALDGREEAAGEFTLEKF